MKMQSPVSPSERAQVLDALRGFALLGVFIANSFAFCGYVFLTPEMKANLFTFPVDKWLSLAETTFVKGKFYSLFSLLFGIGFSIILLRNQQKNMNGTGIFYRRLLVLSLFGLFHSFLLWDGDILLLYALLGLLLPFFKNLSGKTLIICSVIFIFSPVLIDTVKMLTGWHPEDPIQQLGIQSDKQSGIPLDSSFSYYLFNNNAGYDEVLKWCYSGFYYRWSYLVSTNRLLKVFGIFLLGLYIGRKMIYARLEENKRLLKRTRNRALLIGMPLSIVMTYFENDGKSYYDGLTGLADTVFYALSVVPLSIAYASIFCLLWINNEKNSKLKWLAPAGRMALTNYLMQTITGILLYYNIGFGLGVQFGPAIFIPIAIIIFTIQVLYSRLWFQYFNYGPAEWLWRRLVYRKHLPIKKSVSIVKTMDV